MSHIGLIGCGMWGRNLARNLAQMGALAAVSDKTQAKAEEFATQFAVTAKAIDALLEDTDITGIVLATSAPSHVDLAIRILNAGKHVYVEKPLALTLIGAQKIAAAAEKNDRQVMVGHLIRYHAAFIELQAQVRAGAIGTLRHIQANRLAMGRIRNTESVLFDLCPHDLSLIQALTGSEPTKVSCAGASHVTPGIVDTLATTLGFAGGISATMQTSWMSPYKEHRFTVSGTAGSLVFDDTKPWPEKLVLFQDHIRPDNESFIIERASPVALPVAEAEPLKDEMRAFVDICLTGKPVPSNIDEALAVQRTLEAMQAALLDMGKTATPHPPTGPVE
jgi:UDP-2-acetamido-3-amino-2,3-dideoxy-glucuronate N-acetyltransferase